MKIEPRTLENARRLAVALENHADALGILAQILNYLPEQLRTDVDSLANILDAVCKREKYYRNTDVSELETVLDAVQEVDDD